MENKEKKEQNVLPHYYAKTFAGLEELLAEELKSLGADEVVAGRRGVDFGADMATLFRVCMSTRYALRVLRPVLRFEAMNPDELYEKAAKWAWGDVLDERRTFSIDTTIHSDQFPHSRFATLRLKDAIVDHFRALPGGGRPSINRIDPDVRIHLHISNFSVTLSLDAAGESLGRRGYRAPGAIAPLSEVLAAGLLGLSNWRPGTPLYDPMCGSGTFSTEAALWVDGLPVNWHRREFAFMHWRGYDENLFFQVRDELSNAREVVTTQIFASDRDGQALSQTRAALRAMEITVHVDVNRVDFFKLTPETDSGVIVMNPPYGERMEVGDLERFYERIGERIKHHWPGFTAWIISSDREALKNVGLKTKRRIPIFNGQLECRWHAYDLFDSETTPVTAPDASPETSTD